MSIAISKKIVVLGAKAALLFFQATRIWAVISIVNLMIMIMNDI